MHNWLVLAGGRSSMVEPQIVVLDVAGSSPVGHPTLNFEVRLAHRLLNPSQGNFHPDSFMHIVQKDFGEQFHPADAQGPFPLVGDE